MGIEDRFAAFFHDYYDPIYAYARRRVRAEPAADVSAETFMAAWRRFADCPDEPLPWLYGIARRVLANQLRRDDRFEQLGLRLRLAVLAGVPVAVPDPADVVADRDMVRAALARLPARDQELLMLVAWEGLDRAEVAEVVGASKGTTAVRLHRARRRLERVLASGAVESPEHHPAPTAHTSSEA